MSGQPLDAIFKELADDGGEVRTTVLDLGSAEIKLSRKDDLSLITVSGGYSPLVIGEIEKVARQCRGSVGLEFRESGSGPKAWPTVFKTALLTLLKNMRARCERRGETFFLSAPPPKLGDMLKLAGVFEKYRVVDTSGQLATKPGPAEPASSSGAGSRRKAPEKREHEDRTRKRIFHLNTSLKRTASLEKELDSAEKYVRKFLPQEAPTAEGYRFAFSYRSSEKIGGDFFDFIQLNENQLGISIGDVSGHGIDAALIMGISKKVINIRAKEHRLGVPSAVLKQANSDLTSDLNRQTFVTALYAVLDLGEGNFHFARAGHEPPILFYPGRLQNTIMSKGVALGLGTERIFNSQIEDVTVKLEPGWCIFLCTDGLAECRNPKEAIYSRERLTFELSLAKSHQTAQEMLDQLLGAIETFSSGRSQEDDMTAILIQRLPESTTAGARRRGSRRSPGSA